MSVSEVMIVRNQKVNYTKYTSLEFLGLISYIIFIVYLILLVFLFFGMIAGGGILQLFLEGTPVIIIIGLIVGTIGWVLYFFCMFKPYFHKEIFTSFWAPIFTTQEFKDDLKKDGPFVIIIYILLSLLIIITYPAYKVVMFLAFESKFLSKDELYQEGFRYKTIEGKGVIKSKTIRKIIPSLTTEEGEMLARLVTQLNMKEYESFCKECVETEQGRIVILDLSEKKLTSFPSDLSDFRFLKVLNLRSNRITTLPSKIQYLKDLERLDLGENQLESINQSLGTLSNLKNLDLSANKLESFPSWTQEMPSLTNLDLSKNRLTTILNSIGLLKNLIVLDLSQNNLSFLPESIENLTKLQYLDIRGNQIISLSKSITSLPNLKEFTYED